MRIRFSSEEKKKEHPSMATKALIVTYYWPPAGGPGVQRWLQFVKHFKEFDIEPIVYIPENPHYPLVDESFVAEVPTDIIILKTPIKEPYGMAKLFSKRKTQTISSGVITSKKPSLLEKMMLYVRGNFFIPDARIGWVKPSVSFLKEYMQQNKVDVVITTGPPHSLHLIGMQLKAEIGVKWLADFRDPWTTIHYHKELRLSRTSEAKHKKLEKQVLAEADQIVVTSKTTKKEFAEITKQPITVITNGFAKMTTTERNLDKKFTLVHVGSLLSERDPEALWFAIKNLIKTEPGFADDFELKLVGTVSDAIISKFKAYGIDSNVELIGYVSHSEAIRIQHNAQLLLLVEMDRVETKAIIPGKLFEYLAAERPIVALGPKGSDIAEILSETKAGAFFNYGEGDSLERHLQEQYSVFKGGQLMVSSEGIEKYSRRELTKEMAVLVKSLK